MKKYIAIIVLMIAILELNAQSDNLSSENEEYSIITALINKDWNGTGMLMGKNATFAMDWQRGLGNQFIKLEFQNKRKSENNDAIIFKATALYKVVNDTLVTGNWFDNRGVSFPLKGHIKETELIIFWGNEETEMGKTIYRYMNNKVITTEDFIMNNGNYYKFGNATYNAKNQ